MTRKKEPKIKIKKDFIEDCLFSSWRYFIGRHTIAAASHPDGIANFIKENPDLFPKERLEFFGKDIRRCCNDVISWTDGIIMHAEQSASNDYNDALIQLVKAVQKFFEGREINLDELKHTRFKVWLDNDEVEYSHSDNVMYWSLFELIGDLTPWIKLAGYFCPNYLITYKDPGGGEIIEPGFAFPSIYKTQVDEGWHLDIDYETCSDYIVNPFLNRHINPDYIIKIEKIK